MRRAIATSAVAATVLFISATPAAAAESTAQMVDRVFLKPHNSRMTGQMLVNAWRWYGISVRDLLVITGAETSMGDPKLGGELVLHNNFGCLKAFDGYESTKWGALADGTVEVAGKTWLTFPSPEKGVMAIGRLLKVGPRSDPGRYRALLEAHDLAGFARVYYGANVPGLENYITNLKAIDARVVAKARAAGFQW